MRTQTLLIVAAAALAAAVTSSQAQTVYSANVVGYVNLSIPANGTFALVCNQLDTGTNLINNVLANGGLISSSGGSGETAMLIWTGSGFNNFFYYNTADASPSPAGWYDIDGNYCTNTLNPGQAVFLQNPSASAITVTLTGQVDQGTNTIGPVTPGLQFYAEPTALAGTSLDNSNVDFPATSSADYVQLWSGNGYGTANAVGDELQYYDAADAAPEPAGWYDLENGLDESTNPAYWPNVGGGFLAFHGGGTSNWVQTFEVQ